MTSFHEQRKSRNEKIFMVADDDMLMRTMIGKAVGQNFSLIEALDGESACALYKQHLPDILFLDIHLPQKNGYEILEEILSYDPSAFIVIISADAVKDNVIKAMKNGAKGFVCKPFNRETVMRYVGMCDVLADMRLDMDKEPVQDDLSAVSPAQEQSVA